MVARRGRSIRSMCAASPMATATGRAISPGWSSKLDYMAGLGVDAIWLSPIHPSPNRDWGYDVSDYEAVHPDYGTSADFDALLAAAHDRGLKVLTDEVLAHTSDEHAWFRDSVQRRRQGRTGMSGPIPASTAPRRTTGCRCSAARPGPISRRGGNITTTNSCASSPSSTGANRLRARRRWRCWISGSARGVDGFRLDVANAFLHDAALADNPPVPHRARAPINGRRRQTCSAITTTAILTENTRGTGRGARARSSAIPIVSSSANSPKSSSAAAATRRPTRVCMRATILRCLDAARAGR